MQDSDIKVHHHKALSPQGKWKGRAIHPGRMPGMGLRNVVLKLRGKQSLAFRYLQIYSRLRKHAAFGGRSPQQSLDELL